MMKVFGMVVGTVLILIALTAAIMWWTHKQTVNFCEGVTPGMPYKELEARFTQSGHENWLKAQLEDKDHPGVWTVMLPDPSSMGEQACVIKHDRVKLLSSTYQ
jgi:uncharacterized iron-regulated membrane protein